jgi:protein TonB
MRWSTWGILLSVSLHAGAATAIALMPKDAGRKKTTVAVVNKKKDEKKKDEQKAKDEPPPPPPKPIEAPKRAAPKPKPAPENTPPPPQAAPKVAAAAPHPVLDALPNLGLSMAGGPGGVGIAVPAPQGDAPRADKTVENRGPAPKPKDECTEDPVKPKPTGGIPQGRVKAAAAAAGVEGKIRLELMIDENGNVTSARVLSGLGGAVDAAAIADARGAKFTPGTRCGKPAAARLVISMTLRNQE